MNTNDLTRKIIGAAMKVHSALGPGLLESVYHACLVHELAKVGMRLESNIPLAVLYDGVKMGVGFRLDMLVEDTAVLELKAVEAVLPVHKSQLLSYLRLSGKPVGLLINFNVCHLKDGIHRLINSSGSPQRTPAASAAPALCSPPIPLHPPGAAWTAAAP